MCGDEEETSVEIDVDKDFGFSGVTNVPGRLASGARQFIGASPPSFNSDYSHQYNREKLF